MSVCHDDGTFVCTLNGALAKKQGLHAIEIELLKISHLTRDLLFRTMEQTDNPVILRKLADKFDELEFEQQKLWHFDEDKNFHRWFEVPKCTCPKLDNEDLIGCEQKVIDLKCIIHGGKRSDK